LVILLYGTVLRPSASIISAPVPTRKGFTLVLSNRWCVGMSKLPGQRFTGAGRHFYSFLLPNESINMVPFYQGQGQVGGQRWYGPLKILADPHLEMQNDHEKMQNVSCLSGVLLLCGRHGGGYLELQITASCS